MMNYKDDPKKMKSKFKSKCCKCNKEIKKGDPIVYFPRVKKAYCSECGDKEYKLFVESAVDEENYNNGYGV